MQIGQPPDIVYLKGNLSVERASGLKDELIESLGRGDNIVLEFAQLEDIDLSCLQVIHAARISAKAAGKELHFLGPLPPRVARRLAACGLIGLGSERSEDLEAALGSA